MALDYSCQVRRHPLSERGLDLYEMPAVAVEALLRVEQLTPTISAATSPAHDLIKIRASAPALQRAVLRNEKGRPSTPLGAAARHHRCRELAMTMMAILRGYAEQPQRFLREQETTPVDPQSRGALR